MPTGYGQRTGSLPSGYLGGNPLLEGGGSEPQGRRLYRWEVEYSSPIVRLGSQGWSSGPLVQKIAISTFPSHTFPYHSTDSSAFAGLVASDSVNVSLFNMITTSTDVHVHTWAEIS